MLYTGVTASITGPLITMCCLKINIQILLYQQDKVTWLPDSVTALLKKITLLHSLLLLIYSLYLLLLNSWPFFPDIPLKVCFCLKCHSDMDHKSTTVSKWYTKISGQEDRCVQLNVWILSWQQHALQLALITSPEVDLTALLRIHSIYKISCSAADWILILKILIPTTHFSSAQVSSEPLTVCLIDLFQ